MLGRFPDQPCKRDERKGRNDEERDVAHARPVEDDDEWAE